MINVSSGTLPTLQNAVPQPHHRRHGGGKSGMRWSDVLQNSATATPTSDDEAAEAPAAASTPVPTGSINILA